MKAMHKQLWGYLLITLSLAGFTPLQAQTDSVDEGGYITVSGIVKDKKSKKSLEYVNISIPGSTTGTVTNADGEFSFKVKDSIHAKEVEISHLGYFNSKIELNGKDVEEQTVWLTPYTNMLDEVIIHARDPRYLVEEAIKKIPANYSSKHSLLTGFYRETAQKGRRYINISEAVIDIYKTSYDEGVDRDRVQIFKGRKLLSQKASDTLAVKLLGGPNLSVYVDVVKNPDVLLDLESLPYYKFRMEESTTINDMNDHNKATQAILRKKPFGLRFKPVEVSFLVNYKERNGLTYLSYIRNGVRFKCDWKRKLFSTNYTILSEMVVTDGKESGINTIPYKMAFRSSQSLSDKVSNFADESFWGSYNIIEPTESLEHAVNKLKKQHR